MLPSVLSRMTAPSLKECARLCVLRSPDLYPQARVLKTMNEELLRDLLIREDCTLDNDVKRWLCAAVKFHERCVIRRARFEDSEVLSFCDVRIRNVQELSLHGILAMTFPTFAQLRRLELTDMQTTYWINASLFPVLRDLKIIDTRMNAGARASPCFANFIADRTFLLGLDSVDIWLFSWSLGSSFQEKVQKKRDMRGKVCLQRLRCMLSVRRTGVLSDLFFHECAKTLRFIEVETLMIFGRRGNTVFPVLEELDYALITNKDVQEKHGAEEVQRRFPKLQTLVLCMHPTVQECDEAAVVLLFSHVPNLKYFRRDSA